ncbi:prenyltransferase/squalene oxidase repeat-containing protein [Streptomyces sp. FIT100]|uniref:prenyltransferase/squalene oxidase repeat-containing protein n=1 Tax=Streptomyces sp. FIT100 TaxID=2837956 RepID=UPI0021C6378E|nr:prenyltransferase/squalene oxidase repeat-containing protein [Streptomyces sp. FIT100]UUN29714.1 terpene cyclase/mutase family protein [Streptomyces sp. FIT100]
MTRPGDGAVPGAAAPASTPSVYETARLVALAPWLGGDAARINFLMAAQERDGSWGGAQGAYAWVPTLSAVDALLSAADRGWPCAAEAAAAGLRYLAMRAPRGALPDTVAAELLVPSLRESLGQRVGVDLALPHGIDPVMHRRTAERVRRRGSIPGKLLHSYESIAPYCPPLGTHLGGGNSLVGSSPAATAAWIAASGGPSRNLPLVRRLEASTAEHGGGPVSCPTPISTFERLWIRYAEEGAGQLQDRSQAATELASLLGPDGVSGAPGLAPDADDTATAIYLLARLGRPVDTQVLRRFETPSHFACYLGEDTPSPSANAHVLEALGEASPSDHTTRRKISDWLSASQHPDGSWSDKWHASPYYAVYCCAAALHRYGTGATASAAVRQALAWLRATQREDGSWGRWGGTAEETAYALLALARCGALQRRDAENARIRLLSNDMTATPPPLWHDKDLYCPTRVVDACIRAAQQLTGAEARLG